MKSLLLAIALCSACATDEALSQEQQASLVPCDLGPITWDPIVYNTLLGTATTTTRWYEHCFRDDGWGYRRAVERFVNDIDTWEEISHYIGYSQCFSCVSQ